MSQSLGQFVLRRRGHRRRHVGNVFVVAVVVVNVVVDILFVLDAGLNGLV